MEPLIAEYLKNSAPFIEKAAALKISIERITTDESFDEFKEKIAISAEIYKKLQNFKIEVDISKYFLFWSRIQYFGMKNAEIMEIIDEKFGKDMKTFVTQTTVGEILHEERQLLDCFTKFVQRNAPILLQIRKMLAEAIVSMDFEAAAIQKEFRIEPITTDLYVEIMNQLLSKYAAERRFDLTHKIMSLVESDKNWILERGERKIKPVMQFSCFGLIPIGRGRPLEDLAEILRVDKKNLGSIEKLAKCLNSQQVDLIIINKVIEFPIEYDIFGLIGKQLDKNAGISEKSINEFKTVSILDDKNKWDFNVKLYPSKGEKVVVIGRTSDKFSAMTVYFGGPAYLFKTACRELILFAEGKANLKRDHHAEKTIRLAKNHMFLEVSYDIEENINIDFGIKNVINDLFLEIADAFSKKLPKKYPADNSALRDIFVQENFKNIINRVITMRFHEYFRKNTYDINVDKINMGEVYMTFLFHLEFLERAFFKEIGDRFNEFINLENTEKLGVFKQKFEEIVINILEKLITLESNIFLEVHRKIKFLKLSLTK